ncbi:Uncharacterized protein LA080_003090 [Diaporthe eres]|nr:Uncharacterized protein LA080_003090 [Diaporthe eres]
MSAFSTSKIPSVTSPFDPTTDVPDLHDEVYVVMGTRADIGFGTCAHPCPHKSERIHLLGNKEEHLPEAIEALKEHNDVERRIAPAQVYHEDLAATDRAARRLAADLPPPRRPCPQRGPGRGAS